MVLRYLSQLFCNSYLCKFGEIDAFTRNQTECEFLMSRSNVLVTRSKFFTSRSNGLVTRSKFFTSRSNGLATRSEFFTSRSNGLATRSEYSITRSNVQWNPFQTAWWPVCDPFGSRSFCPFNGKPLVYVFPWKVTYLLNWICLIQREINHANTCMAVSTGSWSIILFWKWSSWLSVSSQLSLVITTTTTTTIIIIIQNSNWRIILLFFTS